MKLATLSALNAARRARRAVVLVTRLDDGAQQVLEPADLEAPSGMLSDPALADAARTALRTGVSAVADGAAGRHFVKVEVPPPRLVITGAVHISQALATFAPALGFDMRVIDPRGAFATPERFPGIDLREGWPDEVLQQDPLDGFTAFVALTHDPKIDDPGLMAALRSPCFYVGALGSRKTHARRVERLLAAGFTDQDLARIHAPIGLNIGAVSPAEIALSIMAEIVASLRATRVAARAAVEPSQGTGP